MPKNSLNIGEILKNKREELNLTISEISLRLKVRVEDIEEVEKNSCSKVDKYFYLIEFIRAYAKLLKIDEAIINAKVKELEIKSNISNKKYKLINIGENHLGADKKMVANFAIIFILLFLTILFIENFLENAQGRFISKNYLTKKLQSFKVWQN
jgi:cytoskeletal protein RodZ